MAMWGFREARRRDTRSKERAEFGSNCLRQSQRAPLCHLDRRHRGRLRPVPQSTPSSREQGDDTTVIELKGPTR